MTITSPGCAASMAAVPRWRAVWAPAWPAGRFAAVPLTARGRVVEESFNRPVRVGGIDVSPGDLVLADGSGVVFLAAAKAQAVIEAAEAIAAREAKMKTAVLAGDRVSQVMGRDYETMLQRP